MSFDEPPVVPGRTPLLADYWTEQQLGAEIKRHPRTLARWRDRGIGPPFTPLGNSIFYRIDAVRKWMAEQERSPADIAAAREPRAPGRPKVHRLPIGSTPQKRPGRPRKYPHPGT